MQVLSLGGVTGVVRDLSFMDPEFMQQCLGQGVWVVRGGGLEAVPYTSNVSVCERCARRQSLWLSVLGYTQACVDSEGGELGLQSLCEM
jgi:hypothetical protein